LVHSRITGFKKYTETYMRCGYEGSGMILLQVYPYTYSLLRGVIFAVLPFSSYALNPTMLPLLKKFWNSCCGRVFSAVVFFFLCPPYPDTFVPLRQTLIF
jgi:hypothetical protein